MLFRAQTQVPGFSRFPQFTDNQIRLDTQVVTLDRARQRDYHTTRTMDYGGKNSKTAQPCS